MLVPTGVDLADDQAGRGVKRPPLPLVKDPASRGPTRWVASIQADKGTPATCKQCTYTFQRNAHRLSLKVECREIGRAHV